MKAWMTKALELLKASLEPPKHDLLLPRLLSGHMELPVRTNTKTGAQTL